MRKWLLAAGLVAAIVVVVLLISGGGSSGGGYVVRGIFDSGGFMVSGEEVRVAGATVGEIESVGVTMPGEVDSYENGKPQAAPGKAVIAMKIEDPGFQDFRSDASCLIRPQSLIGEKFVDCTPTLPRAPGSKPAPELKQIPDGKPGAGQYLLPLENNSTSVDPDLINNINQLTYAQRFRLILNELGAGLAGRGEDIEEAVKRANPVLRDADRVFGILDAQRDQLAQLASDSEEILGPLSRQRANVAGFFANAGAAAQASTEKGPELEASLQKLPAFLRELRQTMGSFEYFSNAGTPVAKSLAKAAPALTQATRALTPFSAASTVSLKSLGASGEVAGPKLRAADPVILKTRDLATSGAAPTTELAQFLVSTRKSKGFDGLADLIYNSAASTNEFDRYGHFTRTLAALTNCIDYVTSPTSGCSANFTGPGSSEEGASSSDALALYRRMQESLGGQTGGTSAGATSSASPSHVAPGQAVPKGPSLGERERLGVSAKAAGPQRAFLDYLLGP
jgi:phospholipid/cholesterol/gamma-HCH transport system substrate-binding protein